MKLRVSLENLLAAEQVGRWWIVGSSWSGAPMISEQGNTTSKQSAAEGQVLEPHQHCGRVHVWQNPGGFSHVIVGNADSELIMSNFVCVAVFIVCVICNLFGCF